MKELRDPTNEVRAIPPQLVRYSSLNAGAEGHAPISWDDLPLVLSVEQAAKVVGVGNRAVYEMVRITGFPVVRFGRIIRIPRDAFRQWLNNRVG